MAQNLTKPPKKSTIKARITAAFVAVLALVPMLLLCVGAYPAENYIPSTQTVSLGGSAIPAAWSDCYARVDKLNLVEGEPYAMTYGNIKLSFADATQEWRYVSFEMNLVNYNYAIGHYTIGFIDTAEGLKVRLGRTAFNEFTTEYYPIKEKVSSDVVTFLAGASLTKLRNGQVVIDMQCYGLDANNVVVDTFIFTEVIPVLFDYVDFSSKTEYARLVNANVIDDTSTEYPHMPSDLVAYDTLTNIAHEDGREEVEQTGHIVSSTIWQIISMPFDILASILNFEIFGMNVWSVATALLTIGLIFWVLKKVGVF